MKPLAFNLKDAKKIAGDKHSSTFTLKDGHQIKIAHVALPAAQRKQLEKLPVHLASGGGDISWDDMENMQNGNVDPASVTPDASAPVDTRPTPGQALSNVVDAAFPAASAPRKTSMGNDWDDPAPATAADASQDAAAPAADLPDAGAPVGVQATTMAPTAGTNVPGLVAQGQRAIKEQQDVETQLAAANAKNEQSDIDARQDLLDGFKKNTQDFQTQQKQFMQDYMNNHIDPKHYIESMDSSKKAATAIGLFLGGWGSAYTHQGNPAMDFLNKQIDRDIDAQKDRLGQQKTLMEANQNLYHDNVMANNATRMQMNDIYSHQTQLAAAKLGTPAAKAKADAASAQWGLQNAQLLQQNATRATVLHSMQSGGQGLDPIDLENAGMMPKGEGVKEKASLDAQKTAITSTKNLFDQLNKEQTTGNMLNFQSSRRVDALNAELVNTVMNASASKRLTRESIEAEIKPLEIKTTDDQQTRQSKLSGVLNLIGKHADPTPYTSKIAPKALPAYPYQQASQAPQYTVGQTLYVKGQKVQITDAKGNYKPVR